MLLDYKERTVANLPYGDGFKFVDQLLELDDEHVMGIYHFRKDASFYQHHFIDYPVTPGVLLIECMAQIGLVCLGRFLTREGCIVHTFGFTESNINFLKKVEPGTTVIVTAIKKYYRFNKLKVAVQMRDETGDKIAEGTLAGMAILPD